MKFEVKPYDPELRELSIDIEEHAGKRANDATNPDADLSAGICLIAGAIRAHSEGLISDEKFDVIYIDTKKLLKEKGYL